MRAVKGKQKLINVITCAAVICDGITNEIARRNIGDVFCEVYRQSVIRLPCRFLRLKEYLVFDWGGTFLKYAVMNEETEILEQGRVPAPSRYGTKEEFLAVIDSVVNPYRERISGIAVSSPGILDSDQGIIQVVGVFPYLNGFRLKEELQERYGMPVSLENDGKSAALAEIWKDAENAPIVPNLSGWSMPI